MGSKYIVLEGSFIFYFSFFLFVWHLKALIKQKHLSSIIIFMHTLPQVDPLSQVLVGEQAPLISLLLRHIHSHVEIRVYLFCFMFKERKILGLNMKSLALQNKSLGSSAWLLIIAVSQEIRSWMCSGAEWTCYCGFYLSERDLQSVSVHYYWLWQAFLLHKIMIEMWSTHKRWD